MIGKIKLISGLYLLRIKDDKSKEFSTRSTALLCKASTTTWHKRMGHPSINKIKELSKRIEISDSLNCKETCHVCLLAKQKRLSFPALNNVAENIFDLVHCGIWGPFKTQTHVGHSYFATIVDDKLRYTWVHLLRNKNNILQVIPCFFKLVETQFSKVLKNFRPSNALELNFKELFAKTGTNHQFSCAYTPQHNSVVERKHQYLLNVARTLMFQSKVLLAFWGECVLTQLT